ncbi:hypothetical protein [Haloglomus litoreum]|uniref:hypothetical protein n=1 Tax=Haloglomus litoreum TaxID=3034026 RepID=UPI0023E7752F|nr:hypothetical protein [Haloglomus sp. DT116]
MTPDTQALAVAGAVALLLGGVCVGAVVLGAEPPPPDPYEPTENVPAGSDYVGTLNTTEFRSDPAVRNGTRASLAFQGAVQFYSGPPYLRTLALDPPANASLDPAAASHVTYFGRHGEPYGARLVVANWSAEETTDALAARRGVTFETETRRGFTIYRSERGPAVAVLDGGAEGGPIPREGPRLLAIGNGTAVSDAVDVAIARADPEADPTTLGGELRRRYEDTDDGYVRFAYRFRPETVPDYPFVGPAVRTVEYVGTSYTLNRTDRGNASATPDIRVRIRITSADAESADDVRNIMSAGQSFYLFESSNRTLKTELRRVRLDVEGRTVVTSYESSPRGLRVLVRGLFRNQPEPQSLAAPEPTSGDIDATREEPA